MSLRKERPCPTGVTCSIMINPSNVLAQVVKRLWEQMEERREAGPPSTLAIDCSGRSDFPTRPCQEAFASKKQARTGRTKPGEEMQ